MGSYHRLIHNSVLQPSQVRNLGLDNITRFQEIRLLVRLPVNRNPTRRTGRDNVAWLKGHGREELDQLTYLEDHVLRARKLARLTVHSEFHCQIIRLASLVRSNQ